jgi:4-hydroxybenzoate polyprenyltransferase
VLFWPAGFDVIYSLQDCEFDREQGLDSFPCVLASPALRAFPVSIHVFTVVFLALVGLTEREGVIYWLGFAAVAIVLFWEYRIVAPKDLPRIDREFYDVNTDVNWGDFLSILADANLNSGAGTVG